MSARKVITMRFRDVPFSATSPCYSSDISFLPSAEVKWNELRGQSVKLYKSHASRTKEAACNGPFWEVAEGKMAGKIACAHMLEKLSSRKAVNK